MRFIARLNELILSAITATAQPLLITLEVSLKQYIGKGEKSAVLILTCSVVGDSDRLIAVWEGAIVLGTYRVYEILGQPVRVRDY